MRSVDVRNRWGVLDDFLKVDETQVSIIVDGMLSSRNAIDSFIVETVTITADNLRR
jgi:hypothetical protein